jgi:predicted RNA-binding protein YlxR (DUF448 family)
LVRIARAQGRIVLDVRRRVPGRGAYVHRACIAKALSKGGIARGLRSKVSEVDRKGLAEAMVSLVEAESSGERSKKSNRQG